MTSVLDDIRFPDHVREALDQQKLWRAKEILRGRIGTLPFSPDLYEQYGAVLLEMQDLLQAGKYLFLSGRRRPEYGEAIDIFLARHGKSGKALVDAFPSSAKAVPFAALPESVGDEIVRRGYTPPPERQPLVGGVRSFSKTAGYLALAGCAVLLLFALASIIAGVPVVVRYIVSLLR